MVKLDDCKLRRIEELDLPVVLKWRNSERIRQNMYTDHVISWKEHVAWYQHLQKCNDRIGLIFEYRKDPVGVVSFTNIDLEQGTCFWGFYKGESRGVKGLGSALGFCGIMYGFKQLDIRKISGEALGFNDASIKFHLRLGFKEEGRFRKHIIKNKQYQDILRFGLLSEEWELYQQDLKEQIFIDE